MPGPQRPGFTATTSDEGITVVLSGDLDVVSRSWLARRLVEMVEQQPQRLVFDMAEVSFADSASLRLVVFAGQSLPDGGRLVIVNPRPIVRRVLHITGLDTLCDVT